MGASGSLRKMLGRSLGAKSPRHFWQYWNPIFGFYLGRYIYSPLKRFIPASATIIFTFLFSDFIHDLATIAVRGSTRFLFTTWFFFLAIGVITGEGAGVNWSEKRKPVRVFLHLLYLAFSLGLAYELVIYL